MSGTNHLSQYEAPSLRVKTGVYEDGRPIYTFYATPGPAAAVGPVFNVVDYGATGDGVTDDTAALQATINAAVAAGGGVVLLPSGVYSTSAALVLSGNNIILQGAGGVSGNTNSPRLGATIIKPSAGATYDAIVTQLPPVVGTAGYLYYGLSVRDLAIDGSQMTGTAAGQGNGVHFYGVRYGLIEHVDVFSVPNWAFLIEGDSTNYAYNTTLIDCIAGGPCAAGFRFTNSEQCSMIRCIAEGAATACAASQPYSGSSPGTQAYMLYANVGWIDAIDCTFGNLGFYTNEAVMVDNSETGVIMGCLFDGVRGPAYHSSAGGQIFTNNRLVSPCAAVVDAAIKLGAGTHVVTGNIFQAGTPHYTYAVAELGPYVGNIIADNQLVAGTAGVVSLNATSTPRVHHNVGYNPVGHAVAQPAVPATTVAATNTTGVDCTVFVTGGTVTVVAIGGTATGLTSGAFRVPAGQTITLTYSVAPTWQWFGD